MTSHLIRLGGRGGVMKGGANKMLIPRFESGQPSHPNLIFDVFDSLELTHAVSHVSELFIYLINKDKKKQRWMHLCFLTKK